ncbi:sarcosine oxidase subunit gamma family protein [Methylobacterium sp. Leaf91]|uniref:sarcosine oxidase subunit gamma n=1 Tax=Methylobacterium sp. Leaf91 TaxID=1736247 RepID=UPI0006FC33BE|nr:sarcosine oxidase subunit gamma family protein [Methylobacterium sp. Leaf91]KQO93397.1 sarcosine oxidase subunit gamma [Methylobacterium sp. Leaf91]
MSDVIETTWRPRSAWAGIAPVGRHGRPGGEPGLTLTLRDEFGLATVIAVKGRTDALQQVLGERFGWSLPDTGTASLTGERGLVWSGPDQWLALFETRQEMAGLGEALQGIAAVTDQSDARAIVRVSGPDARAFLAKGLAIDLHPRAFQPGQVAVTALAHMGAQIWQRDAAPIYDLAVARSFAGSVWSWLSHAAAEFGYDVRNAAP